MIVGEPFDGLPSWDRFAALTDAARPEMDALEAELDRGVSSASGSAWNTEACRLVTTALDRLGV